MLKSYYFSFKGQGSTFCIGKNCLIIHHGGEKRRFSWWECCPKVSWFSIFFICYQYYFLEQKVSASMVGIRTLPSRFHDKTGNRHNANPVTDEDLDSQKEPTDKDLEFKTPWKTKRKLDIINPTKFFPLWIKLLLSGDQLDIEENIHQTDTTLASVSMLFHFYSITTLLSSYVFPYTALHVIAIDTSTTPRHQPLYSPWNKTHRTSISRLYNIYFWDITSMHFNFPGSFVTSLHVGPFPNAVHVFYGGVFAASVSNIKKTKSSVWNTVEYTLSRGDNIQEGIIWSDHGVCFCRRHFCSYKQIPWSNATNVFSPQITIVTVW